MTEKHAFRHILLAVYGVLACAFILAPLLITVVNSFSSVAYNVFPPEGLSFRWYVNLAAQSEFYVAGLRSIILALSTMAVTLTIGTMAAYALVRFRFIGRGAVNGLLMAPVVIPNIAIGVAMFMFIVRLGIVGHYSNLLVTHALVSLPFVVVIVSVGFTNFDWSLEEAARDLGAGPFATFFRVLMPQIRTNLIIGGAFAFITSFDQVETTLFLVRPDQNTLPVEMFLYLQKWQDPTISALAVVLIVFAAFLLVLLSLALRGRQQIASVLRAERH